MADGDIGPGISLANVDRLFAEAEEQIGHAATADEAIEVIRSMRRALAITRVQIEAEAILAAAAAEEEAGRDG